MDTTTATINTFFQLSIAIEHNGRVYQFFPCHIFHTSKINLAGSYQAGRIQFSPRNKSIKCVNILRKISPHGNGTPISRGLYYRINGKYPSRNHRPIGKINRHPGARAREHVNTRHPHISGRNDREDLYGPNWPITS